MTTAVATRTPAARSAVAARDASALVAGSRLRPSPLLDRWVRAQHVNLERHATGLGPFAEGSFGRGPAAPNRSHLQAVNRFISGMQRELAANTDRLGSVAARLQGEPPTVDLAGLLELRAKSKALVEGVELVWDFYFRVFSQRETKLGPLLRATDRIALDCYQAAYLGLGAARSIPSPAPFSYMHGERGAATFRRGVAVSMLGHRANPFPLVKLPYHRLLNAWTLGAVPHEVAHNLQADLGLWTVTPRRIVQRLSATGIDGTSTATWARWHKEIFADLCGVLLAGPAYVSSLLEVVSRRRQRVRRWSAAAVHPTPYLRPLISLTLLRKLDFQKEAAELGAVWRRLYPPGADERATIPPEFARTFESACRSVVDTICFTPYQELGNRKLAEVTRFGHKELALIREAATRLAAGTDPGVIPGRFLIGAARMALDQELAAPGVINDNFYEALNGR